MTKNIKFDNRDRYIQLGIIISSLRKLRGMSQEQLAEKSGVSRTFLSKVETPNAVSTFSLEVLFNISDALEVNAGDLLNASIFPESYINLRNSIKESK